MPVVQEWSTDRICHSSFYTWFKGKSTDSLSCIPRHLPTLAMWTAPFADAAPGYLFSPYPVVPHPQMRSRRLSHRQLSRDRGQRCLEAFQPQPVLRSVLCLLVKAVEPPKDDYEPI